MAILTELGRNSAAITYGAVTTGLDLYPTFGAVDKWLRNDTLQGTATAANAGGTVGTVTGSSSAFLGQLKQGDVIIIAGQVRTVASVSSDFSFTVTATFSPEIPLSSTVRVLNQGVSGTPTTYITQGSGTAATSVLPIAGNTTVGTVSFTAGSTTVTGVGTYFTSECTNSITVTGTLTGSGSATTSGTALTITGGAFLTELQPGDSITLDSGGTPEYLVIASVTDNNTAVLRFASTGKTNVSIGKVVNSVVTALNGTYRTISINGRTRWITGITNNTTITINAPFDYTDSNLPYSVFPRGAIATTANNATVTGTGTNFKWDLPGVSSQVWIGDELHTFTPSSPTVAALTDPAGWTGTVGAAANCTVAYTAIPFRRDDSLITYTGAIVGDEFRVGDDIMINRGSLGVTQCVETTITAIVSDTQFRVSQDMLGFTGATVYKKKKMHGYTLEGTREGTSGTATQAKFSVAGATTYAATTSYQMGSNQITVNAISAATHVAGNFVKIQNAGGPAKLLTGTATVAASTGVVTGSSNAQFGVELHVGAEVYIGGVYGWVSAITSNTSMTITGWSTIPAVGTAAPIYRTTPLYTYITAVTGNVLTLYHPIKNNFYLNTTNATSAPGIQSPLTATAGEYIEFVYSAPNAYAEGTTTLVNRSLDRKYFGFRYYPLAGGANTVIGSQGAYNVVVYERWTSAWAGAGGAGLNKADSSDSVTANGVGLQVTDQTVLSQQAGGYLYLFAKPRYFLVQGKTFANVQQQWLGCIEFERAQAEDKGDGTGTATVPGTGAGTGALLFGALTATGYQYQSLTAPWPCFAYFNSSRFPIGAQLTPTQPVAYGVGVHGAIFAVPRMRSSAGFDLVGVSAHVFSAATITTGRWGHLYEMGGSGSYQVPTGTSPIVPGTGIATTAATTLVPHLGNLVPSNTNVYNSKRFMFSPVVVLGPAWDPDIRGRIFGLKIIPGNLGTLMDTVSVTIDAASDFYSTGGTATDHWVITSPNLTTYRFTVLNTTTATAAVSAGLGGYRNLDDNTAISNTIATSATPFRYAIPT